jgi:hypothetical protein
VIKVETLPVFSRRVINNMRFTNITYILSEISFFDFGSVADQNFIFYFNNPYSNVPMPGDIAVIFKDSRFESNILREKLTLFSTQGINLRDVFLKFENTLFRNNTLEKGYMFEFKHNFRMTVFLNSTMEDNHGHMMELTPLD